MNNIEHGLRTKPARLGRPNRLISKSRIGIINLNRLRSTPGGRSIGQQLRIAAFIQTHKPEKGLLDRAANSQQTVVL